jgi:hypothetical protein
VFVDELVCMIPLPWLGPVFGGVWLWWWFLFELTNDDSGDCLLVDRVWSAMEFFIEVSMESLILAQDERWRRA